MVLQFQGAPDWLLQEYMNRKTPTQEALDTVGGIAQGYSQAKMQQNNQRTNALEAYTKLLDSVGPDQAPIIAKKAGILDGTNLSSADFVPNQPTTPPIQPPQSSTSTLPTPMEQNSSMSVQSEHPLASEPVVAAHIQSTGHNPLGYQMPTQDQFDQWGRQGTYGKKQQDKALAGAKFGEALQTASEKNNPVPVMTKEAAIAAGKVTPNTKIVEPPAPRLDLSEKESQFYQKEWDKIVKDANPLTASSRTTLGMATKANFQADRALVTLSKPVVTNQEAGNAMADIASIYQTGSPTQYGMSHQEYSTLYGKIQGALQTVTGTPQDALPDAVKQRLVEVLHDMKQTNRGVLKQSLDYTQKSKARIINKFPDEWKDIRSTLEDSQDSGAAIPASGPHGASVVQNGHTYNWNSKTGQYE